MTWVDTIAGGDSSAVASLLTAGVASVTGSFMAFVAVKADGSVVTWGSTRGGGDISAVSPSKSMFDAVWCISHSACLFQTW